MKRLAELCQPTTPDLGARRGFSRQRTPRQREQTLRINLVHFQAADTHSVHNVSTISVNTISDESASPMSGAGEHRLTLPRLTLPRTAELLGLSPRTLRYWHQMADSHNLQAHPLGRPTLRSPRIDRNAVIELLNELGPATGVPTLRAAFPDMPRAELDDLVKRYRRVWRKRHYEAMHILRWQQPGTVWAMDFSEAPEPIDGLYPYLLAVRDLASGQQLLWLPITNATAVEAQRALDVLFHQHGAPLVMKTDNGSPFCAADTLNLLTASRVIPLFSPPYTPRYNGAIEAGIGSLKSRTQRHAARHGRPDHWTWDDVAAAQFEANATARPKGPTGPTPDELWTARRMITPEERTLFETSVNQERTEARLKEGHPTEGPLSDKDAKALDRQAIRRALEKHDLLLYARRRLPLTITNKKVARIT